MRCVFCTIITEDYMPFARTLFESIREFDKSVACIALVVDAEKEFNEEFELLCLDDLSDQDLVSLVVEKYSQNSNALRWSLKSILMIHLLKIGKYDQVFFVDPDIRFYSDFKFLYQDLGTSPFLLSPHWGCMDPSASQVYFSRLMTDGLYNAGFLGATKLGLPTLYWWANSCLFACERNKVRGLHDDQGYLNLFPILSPGSKITTHRGCNVAEWNRFENTRSLGNDGKLLLNDKYPLVFIHFSNLGYLVEHDPLLIPYLQSYEKELTSNGFSGSLVNFAQGFVNRQRLKSLTIVERIIRKLIGKRRFSSFKGW